MNKEDLDFKHAKEIAARYRHLRVTNGYTQARLGKAIGKTFQQVQKYETGHQKYGNRISANIIKKTAGIYGIDPGEFYKNDIDNNFGMDHLKSVKLFGQLSNGTDVKMVKDLIKHLIRVRGEYESN